jgi:hypothetical protein
MRPELKVCACTDAYVCRLCIQDDPDRPQWQRDGHDFGEFLEQGTTEVASGASDEERSSEPEARPGKWCPGCLRVRAYAEFWRNRANRDGLQSRCKACIKNVRLEVREQCPTCGSWIREK